MADDWVACPHCGERISRKAKSCRHCGSDDSTGWSEGTYMDGIDVPEEGDYEEGLEAEGFRKPAASGSRIAISAVSVILLLLFALWLLRNVF
ncbi:MAG: zinc ribbon domain-containing protein [Fibrobacterota bacterium]|nr:zinc ribbon domain-containing protein [Fibrobacterota bacterium]